MKTELDIINSMLISVNNAPVQTLENNTSPDVYNARAMLNSTRISILAKNWFCNQDTITIVPDVAGKCYLPNNLLKATPLTRDVVDRGGVLYDNRRTSYVFDTPQKVNVLIDLKLEDIPFELAEYIEAESVYKFYRAYGGDTDMTQFYYKESTDKKATALSADYRDRKANNSRFTAVRIRYGEAY